jgi:protein-S-isoprenylcysteine O-methyltransferase Ste14
MMTFLARRRVPLGFLAAVCAALLARPTKASWLAGLAIAILGEAIRLWASGHLEKSREVTRTGPYRWTAHPLYVGSSVMALGVVVAAHSAIVGVLVAIYMTATITAAVRTEEAFLRRSFGPAYDQYRRSEGTVPARRFSVSRVLRNREYRAVAGLSIGFALLALKVVLEI